MADTKADMAPTKAKGKETKTPAGRGKAKKADKPSKHPTRPQVFAEILEQVKGQPVTRKQLASMLDERYSIAFKGKSNESDEYFWSSNYVGLLLAVGLVELANGHEVVYTGKGKVRV